MKNIFGFVLSISLLGQAMADTVWHCSKSDESRQTASSEISLADQFSIASMSSTNAVVGVSIRDLIDIYSGVSVYVGGLPLSACFIPSNEKMSKDALLSLGLQPSVIQTLSRRSAIVESHLYVTSSAEQMLQCIERHYPAVGYLPEATETAVVAPCF